MLAEEKFEFFYKYKKFFMKHDADEEPPGGVPAPEARFFTEARNEKSQIPTSKKEEAFAEAPKSFKASTKADLKKEMLKDSDFVTEVGQGSRRKGEERIQELSKSDWHRKSNLTGKEAEALKRMGYAESKQNVYDFDGNLQAIIAYNKGGFSRESMHHFSKAHFTKEVLPQASVREKIAGSNKEIDAVLPLPNNKKIAVEFQESHKLGPSKVLEKVKPILEHYNLLVIVCPERAKEKYEHVKSKRVHILNNGEFKDFLESLKKPDDKHSKNT